MKTLFDKIPVELRVRPQWVCWRLETRDGRATKIPFDAVTGKPASSTDQQTWHDFNTAAAALGRGAYSGLGFVFSKDDPFAGIDLDHVRDPQSKEVAPWARDLVRRLNSYAELSQSGTGAHVIIKAKVPGDRRRKSIDGNGQGVEMYDADRFFVMTGQQLSGVPASVEDRQLVLNEVHAELFGAEPVTPPPAPAPASLVVLALSDRELITRASAAGNGAKFASLWRGDWQAAGYGSQSDADAALLGMLRFWTSGDKTRSLALFTQSGLNRDKWADREDYRERTWAKIATGDTYSPPVPAILGMISQEGRMGAGGDAQPVNPDDPEGQGNRRTLTLWKPSQFIAYKVDPSSILLGDGYLEKGDWTSLVGIGGLGKTRLALWLAICQITGREWCGLMVSGEPQKTLILSTETGIRRWKFDLERFFANLTDAERGTVDEKLLILALTSDEGGDLNLGNPEAISQLMNTLADTAPGIVILDPWADLIAGDENKAADVILTVRSFRAIIRKVCPAAATLVVAHARTGSANVVQAGSNFNAGNFGRGSKALYSAVRCEIQLAPRDDEDPNKLLILCGKSNNAAKFEPRAIDFDAEKFTYRVNGDFDVETWRDDVNGKRRGQTVSIAQVVEAVRERYNVGEDVPAGGVIDALMAATGGARRTIQRRLQEACKAKYLRTGKLLGTYRLGEKPLPKGES